jgi:SpoVK/Ycf46/Vps4 family AAA+-type ATPase
MATAQQLKALLESYAEGDHSRFLSVASQISAHAAKTGKQKLSDELRRLVEQTRQAAESTSARSAVPIAQPSGELSGLVAASYPKATLDDMVLTDEIRHRLQRLLREYRQADTLANHGLMPRRKLLLLGPPGCGKSMTAQALAGELHLPLLTVQFHSMITKYMGETAAKLRIIFEAMRERRGVYLFDEFDAIGSQRHAGHDIGEIRRVLNSFLVFIENDDSQSVLVAASNLESTIDQAVFRRFDDVLTYTMPTDGMLKQLVSQRLSTFMPHRLAWKSVITAAHGLSHADVVHACDDAIKDAILDGHSATTSAHLVRVLEFRHKAR